MSPQERKRRRRRIVLGRRDRAAGARGRRGGLRRSPAQRATSPTPTSSSATSRPPRPTPRQEPEPDAAAASADRGRPLHLGRSTATRATGAATCRSKTPLRPPFSELWQYHGNVLLEFPPVIGGKRLYLLNDSRRLLAIDKHTGQGAVEAQARRAGRRLARLRRRDGLRRAPAARARAAAARGPGGSSRSTARPARSAGAARLASRSESSPLVADGTLYFGSENGTRLRAARARRHACAGVPGRRRGQGRRSRWPTAGSTSATTAGASTRSAPASGRRSGAPSTQRRALRARRGQLLLHARRSPTGASTSATPTAGCTRSRRASGKLAWSKSTGGYVYASPAVAQVPGRRADGLRRLLQRPLLRARRAQRRACAGRAAATGGSPAAPTVIGDIVYFADLGNKQARSGSARAPAARSSSTSAAPTTRSSPTARRSSSPATTRSTRSSR